MKQKHYIVTAKNHGKILQAVSEIEADGKTMVTIGNATNKRHNAQNRLVHFWYKYISVAQDNQETPAEVKAYCKYNFGVPIMMFHEEFASAWNLIKRFEYEEIMIILQAKFPVTSLMSVKECTEYINAVQRHYAQKGIMLPTGDDLYYEAMGFTR